MARKGWDRLSPEYRARLQRQGVTEEQYRSGSPLHHARGHTSPQKERQQSSFYRYRTSYAENVATRYGVDSDDIKESLRGLSEADLRAAVSEQQRMTKLYESGRWEEAHNLWERRQHAGYPEWMNFYHGMFSYRAQIEMFW